MLVIVEQNGDYVPLKAGAEDVDATSFVSARPAPFLRKAGGVPAAQIVL